MADRREQSPNPVEVLASRFDATVAEWRQRLRGQIFGGRVDGDPEASIATVQSDLGEQLRAIDLQAAEIEQSFTREIAQASRAEERAMAAVRAYDDAGARAALTEHEHHANAAATLQAELTLLKEMAIICREALASLADRARTISHPVAPPSNDEL